MKQIPASELIINSDGSIFHLHLQPDDLLETDTVILVGDPSRVQMIARHFDKIDVEKANREFISKIGRIGNKRFMVLSTGIGIGNIDIAMTELDALVNIDFTSRCIKSEHRALQIVRMGTSGALHADIPLGSMVMSDISAGFDGLLNFYDGRNAVCMTELEEAFIEHTKWSALLPKPYFVPASKSLTELFADGVIHGITASAPGFYAPQGRVLRLALHDADFLRKIESFNYKGQRIMNFEMEGSAIAGLSLLLGHRAVTLCTIIANRHIKSMNTDYKPAVEKMIELCINNLILR
ncbi:MAG: nucleoside phosphorylase [Prevotellaceae bacterium]|nr:nucleoside phosphorylase [Prevotellaceae bacterium]